MTGCVDGREAWRPGFFPLQCFGGAVTRIRGLGHGAEDQGSGTGQGHGLSFGTHQI